MSLEVTSKFDTARMCLSVTGAKSLLLSKKGKLIVYLKKRNPAR